MVQLAEKPVSRVDEPAGAAQARALSIILREEFDASFAFFDPATGALVHAGDSEPVEVDPTVVREVALAMKARATRLSEHQYRVCLVFGKAGKPALVAVGHVPALTHGGTQAALEQARLQKWAQTTADRLHLADQNRRRPEDNAGAANAAWEVVLTLNQLTRRLRIHKDPEKNHRRILEGAHHLLKSQALIWLPNQPEDPILIQGDAGLAPADCRQLAHLVARHPDLQPGLPLLINRVPGGSWGARFPGVRNILAFQLTEPGSQGWVIALNKQPGSEADFRRSDAALLTPFISLLEMHLRSSTRYQELKELLVGLTRSLTSALDAKDPYTFGHSERVARIAVELGREMSLTEDELGDIYLSGLLHDVGKIGIRDTVLCKPGALTPEEFEHIKQHVTIGYTILSGLKQIRNLLPGVLYHHERYDGTGYPDKLAGEAIPLMARILAVADAYDAMSTNRPYRDSMPCRKVEEILIAGANKQWDGRIIEAFERSRQKIHAIRQRGLGDSLRLAIDGALRTIAVASD